MANNPTSETVLIMFQAFRVACFIASSVCFLVAVSRPKLAPRNLDILALGLFLFTLPYVVEQADRTFT